MPAHVEAQIEKRRAHWIWTAVMSLTLISTLAYAVVLYDALRFNTGKIDKPSQLTDGASRWILKQYWMQEDRRWIKFHELEYPKSATGEPVRPPFHKDHRKYDETTALQGITYEEPDKPLPETQLENIRLQILQKRGEVPPPPPGGGAN